MQKYSSALGSIVGFSQYTANFMVDIVAGVFPGTLILA